MCRQVDNDFIIDVAPFGMVIHFFRFDGRAGHETERFDEVSELEFASEFIVFK